MLQRIKTEIQEDPKPCSFQKLRTVEATVDRLSKELHRIRNPADTVVSLTLVITASASLNTNRFYRPQTEKNKFSVDSLYSQVIKINLSQHSAKISCQIAEVSSSQCNNLSSHLIAQSVCRKKSVQTTKSVVFVIQTLEYCQIQLLLLGDNASTFK